LALRSALAPLDHLDHGLLGNQDLVEEMGLAHRLRTLEQRLHGSLLVPRVGMDDVPLLRHRSPRPSDRQGRIIWTACPSTKSTVESTIVMIPTSTSTPIVPAIASLRDGQVTLRYSARTSE